MNNETMRLLEQQFDTAFAAPDGIQKLRELILTLAMQGKLVPQDPSDQPASELLKAIEAEKGRLVKEGKIKQPKLLPDIKPEEVPYELPKGWKWVRLGCVGAFERGRSKHRPRNDKRLFADGSYPFVQTGDVSKSKFTNNEITSCSSYYNDFGLQQSRLWPKGTLCITIAANIAETGFLSIEACIPDSVVAFLSVDDALSKIVKVFIDVAKQDLEHYAPSTAQKNINLGIINDLIFPLPPLAEQRRIVAKIDQLMARCDELEKLRSDRAQKLITVHTAAIAHLLTAQDSHDFSTAWHFITQHFGELYSVKATVAELRKTILQLAVMGKLVPQDPNDEPASELLKAIELEKQRLVKEGEIKKSKPLPNIKSEEFPHELPNIWTWVRLGSLAKSIDYGTSMKADDDSTKVPVYRMGNIANGQLINSNFKYIDRDIDDLPKLFLWKNDILFNRTNSYELVGKTAIYLGQDDNATFASYLIRIRLAEKYLLPTYFNMAMNSPYFRRTQIEPEIVQQCGQANFNGSKLSLTIIPLPPLAEQHRIVAKVDQLMALCDRLEGAIAAAQAKQTDLLNAVMAQV